MALQVMAPQAGGVGANVRAPKFNMSVPEFKNFGPAPEIVNPVGEAAEGLFNTLLKAQAQKQKMRDTEDVASAVHDLQKQAVQFQSDWKSSHFGTEARDAGKVFSKHVDDTALKMIEDRFSGRPELAAMFRRQAMQISFNGFTHGTQYDDHQDLEYRKSSINSLREDLNTIIATGTDDQIASAVAGYKTTRDAYFPGANFADDDRKVNRQVHAGLVNRSITAGDMAGAQARLEAGVKSGAFGIDDVSKITGMIERGFIDQINIAGANGDVDAVRRAKASVGGAPSVNGGSVSSIVANATSNFSGKTSYGFGSKKIESGKIDCSGWIAHLGSEMGMPWLNGSSGQIVMQAQKHGRAVTEDELDKSPREGMVIGIDTGSHGWDDNKDHPNGIDHVVMTYKDPKTGVLMVTESSRGKSSGKNGVQSRPFEEWYSIYKKKGARFFAGDVSGQISQPQNQNRTAYQIKVDAAADSQLKQIEARITAGSREAEALAKFGDYSKMNDIAKELREKGFTESADRYDAAVKLYKDTADSRKWASSATIGEVRARIDQLQKSLDPEMKSETTGGKKSIEEYESAASQLKAVTEVYNTRVKEYQKDPASAAMADGIPVPENATPDQRAEAILEVQKRNGVSDFNTRILTNDQAESFKRSWNEATPMQKVSILTGEDGILSQYGKYSTKVLSELGISVHDQFIASAVASDPRRVNEARMLWDVINMQDKDVPVRVLEDGVNRMYLESVQQNGVFKVLQSQFDATRSPQARELWLSMERTAKRMLKMGKSPKEVLSALSFGRDTVVDDDRAVFVPDGLTEDNVDTAIDRLAKIRIDASLPAKLRGNARSDEVSRMMKQGVWVNAPDGDGFVLVNRITQRPEIGVRISRNDVANIETKEELISSIQEDGDVQLDD